MENREIKFRAWNDVKKRMEHDVYKEYRNLMQYTGLKDKNGVEIYEGDILYFTVFDHNDHDTQYKGVVQWVAEGACYDIVINEENGFELGWTHAQDAELEVIGNIYEDPELLER